MANPKPRPACADRDPELWFPVGHSGPAVQQAEYAKAICARCPLQVPCLEWALDHNATHGIWGGLTDTERRNVKRNRALRQPTEGEMDGPANRHPMVAALASA